MSTINVLVWLLPVLFILHDMEEIIFSRTWKENEKRLKKYCFQSFVPLGSVKDTEGCAIGVYEELLILCTVCLVSQITNWYGLWYGMMAANILHLLLLHMTGLVVMYRTYVPGMVSAFLTFIPCAYVFVRAQRILHYGVAESIFYIMVSAVIAMINLRVLHKNAYRFSVKKKYDIIG